MSYLLDLATITIKGLIGPSHGKLPYKICHYHKADLWPHWVFKYLILFRYVTLIYIWWELYAYLKFFRVFSMCKIMFINPTLPDMAENGLVCYSQGPCCIGWCDAVPWPKTRRVWGVLGWTGFGGSSLKTFQSRLGPIFWTCLRICSFRFQSSLGEWGL